jgi:phage-related protein
MGSNEVKIVITGDAARFKKSLGEAETGLAGFSSKMEAAGSKLRSIGSTLTTGLTLPIVGAGVVATKWAMDAEEAANKVNVVFGQSAVFIDHWGKTSATAFGLSKGQAMDAFGTIGTMLQGFGIETAKLPTMSNDILKLAADLGSFHNLNTAEVLDMISASFRGEFDSIQRVIPTINAAAVETEALAMTGKKNAKALTEQEKAMATYSLVMKGAGPAVGDFARTQDSATNSTKIAMAQFRTAAETIGANLLPVVVTIAEKVAQLAEKFGNLSPTMQKVVIAGAALLAAIGPVVSVVGALVTAIGFIASPVGLVVAAIAALVAGLVIAYQKSESFRAIVDSVARTIRDQLALAVEFIRTTILPALQQGFEQLKPVLEAWGQFLIAVFQRIGTTIQGLAPVWQAFASVVSFVMPLIQNQVAAALRIIQGIIQVFTAVVSGNWSSAWNGIKNVFSGIWDGIRGIVTFGVQAIKNSLGGVVTWVNDKFGGIGAAISAPFSAGFGAIKSAWNSTIGGRSITMPDLPGLPGRGQTFRFPTLHNGGIVPGRRGAEVMANLQAGEMVLSLAQVDAMRNARALTAGGGTVINVTVNAGVGNPAEIGRTVVDTIKAYEARNGVSWRAS